MSPERILTVAAKDLKEGDEVEVSNEWREIEATFIHSSNFVEVYFKPVSRTTSQVITMSYPSEAILNVRRVREAERIFVEDVREGDVMVTIGELALGEGLRVDWAGPSQTHVGCQQVTFAPTHNRLTPAMPAIRLPFRFPVEVLR